MTKVKTVPVTVHEILAAPHEYIIVHDGQVRWLSNRNEIYAYLDSHDIPYTLDTCVTLPAPADEDSIDPYYVLCVNTTCYASTCGSYRMPGVNTVELLNRLADAGTPCLYVR